MLVCSNFSYSCSSFSHSTYRPPRCQKTSWSDMNQHSQQIPSISNSGAILAISEKSSFFVHSGFLTVDKHSNSYQGRTYWLNKHFPTINRPQTTIIQIILLFSCYIQIFHIHAFSTPPTRTALIDHLRANKLVNQHKPSFPTSSKQFLNNPITFRKIFIFYQFCSSRVLNWESTNRNKFLLGAYLVTKQTSFNHKQAAHNHK